VCNDGRTWTRWQENGGWLDRADHVRSYAEAPDGTLAFGRFSGRVTQRERDGFRELPPLRGTGGAWCVFDRDGLLYGTRVGFAGVFRDGAWQPLTGEPLLDDAVLGVGTDRDGEALLICKREVLRVRGGAVVTRMRLSQAVAGFWQLSADPAGNLWLSALDAGVYRIQPDGTVKHFLKEDGLPHSAGTRVVFADEHDSVWIGSGVGGLARLRPKRFRYIGETEGLAERVILTLAPLRDGRVLMTTYGAGPAYFDGVRAVGSPALETREAAFVRTAVRAHDDTVWLGTFGHGLLRFADNTLTPVSTGIFGANESIDTMYEDSRHRLWVGGEQHVAVGENGRFSVVSLPDELQRRRPTLFAELRDGTVLLAKHHEIYAFTSAGFQPVPLVKLPDDWRVSTLLVDSRNRLWIGTTAQGLIVFHEGKWHRFPVHGGLPDLTISSLVRDDAGRLWFGSGRAIVRADPDELWQFAQGGGEPTIQIFDTNDGLHELDLPYGTQPCVAKDDRGRLWFALVRGAAMIDPATLKIHAAPPPVLIESFSYVPQGGHDRAEIAVGATTSPPVLPAGSRMIRIRYAALDFVAPGKQNFRVRLGDGTAPWQDVREETSIDFLELPPGRHVVQVQASSGDGAWNRTGATLAFELAPFYWQTQWFRALLGMGLIGLIGGSTWLVSHWRVRRAQESLERERRFAEVQDALRGLAMKLTESVEPEALGRAVAVASYSLFRHDAFFLSLVDSSGRSGTCPYMEDTPAGRSKPEPIAGGSRPVTMTLARVMEGEPQLVNRSAPTPENPNDKLVSWGFVERRSMSLMFAPVLWNGRVTGMVSVQSYTPQRYREQDLRQLQILAAHSGAAIARLEAEMSLRRNEERLRLAMQSARMGSWEIDAATGRLFAPAETESVYECAPGALAGFADCLVKSVPADEANALRQRLQDLIAGRIAELEFIHRIVTPAGAERWLELRARRQSDPKGDSPARILGVSMDITARRLAELERTKLEDQLRQSQKLEAVGTLAGGIAHDFNNILMAIIGNVELATVDVGPSHAAHPFLAAIRKSGLRARDLVSRILAFSRPSDSVRRLTALLPVVEEVVTLLQSTIPASVELRITAASELPLVEINGTEIHQVLLNLGTNAWHALEGRPGRIEFTLDTCMVRADQPRPAPELRAGHYVRVVVADNGSGIAPLHLPRIFDPFFTTKQPGQGTGLGLSVAHGIMRACGGAITVHSSVGLGSTFTLYFPASQSAAEVAKPAPVGSPPVRGRGERILYVDDESLLIMVVERMLSRAGFEVVTSMRPEDALKLFAADPTGFALVVSDYSMPGMTGLDLAKAIMAIRPETGVIVITGYQREGVAAAAARLGVRAVMNKADTPTELLPLIERELARNRTAPA
jgi:signal transduction histidine kinase/ligand-binding sensor domain-containing protein/ActR/RegA family two-component response regulator